MNRVKMMAGTNKLYLLFLLVLIGSNVQGQMVDPVKWEVKAECVGKGKVKVIATATIEEGWHVYDVVKIEEDDPIKAIDVPNPTRLFTDDADKFKDVGETTSPTEVHNDYDKALEMNSRYYEGHVVIERTIDVLADVSEIEFYIEYQACDDEKCTFPPPEFYTVAMPAGCGEETSASSTGSVEPKEEADNNNAESDSLWWLFIAGMGGGLLALLTPCVFPMIPMTVNFFVKQSGNRGKSISNAILYGLAIVVIYTGLGFTLTKTLGPNIMNTMASDAIVNLIFFGVFVLFGISFLGAFEITLPSWIVNKSDQQADKGGLIGIFFMAFTLAVVSFSCTGPIIGTQLVLAAQSGHNAGPLVTMFGFSFALAIPFMLFAIFPSWLANLPKSGGWLNSVKVVLGLLELALALKFFSTADLAYHWGILSREVFVALWVVLFAMIGFYLLGKLKFSHDSDIPHISVPRVLFATVFLAFSVYMVPGLWGAPLKLLSGLAPPRNNVEDIKWMRRGMDGVMSATSGDFKVADHCPNGLPCSKDYDYAIQYAKEQNKPIFLDFTGYSCVNCRKMEDNVWVDPKIDRLLRENYVIVSLYVDDKEKLPAEEQRIEELNGKKFKIATVGNKWTYKEITEYGKSSQPYYVLLGPDEKPLVDPVAYTPDVDDYAKFLQEGLDAFKKKYKNSH